MTRRGLASDPSPRHSATSSVVEPRQSGIALPTRAPEPASSASWPEDPPAPLRKRVGTATRRRQLRKTSFRPGASMSPAVRHEAGTGAAPPQVEKAAQRTGAMPRQAERASVPGRAAGGSGAARVPATKRCVGGSPCERARATRTGTTLPNGADVASPERPGRGGASQRAMRHEPEAKMWSPSTACSDRVRGADGGHVLSTGRSNRTTRTLGPVALSVGAGITAARASALMRRRLQSQNERRQSKSASSIGSPASSSSSTRRGSSTNTDTQGAGDHGTMSPLEMRAAWPVAAARGPGWSASGKPAKERAAIPPGRWGADSACSLAARGRRTRRKWPGNRRGQPG